MIAPAELKPRLLYHGTVATALDGIKARGLLPRAMSKRRSNWTHTVHSNRNAVYLTDAYAWHFARIASDEHNHGVGLMLEIDRYMLLPWYLCPDEDVLEQMTRKQGPSKEWPNLAPIEWSMERRTAYYRKNAKFNAQLADLSLEKLGTVAYYHIIPPCAIKRYVLIEWGKLPSAVRMVVGDSTVSTMAYMIRQNEHRALTRWFFGEDVRPEEVNGNTIWMDSIEKEPNDKTMMRLRKQNEVWAEQLKNRDGLTIIDVKEKVA